MSNQTFHLPRFMRYAKTDCREKKRTYGWFFGIIAMIYFLILLMVLLRSPGTLTQWGLHAFLYYASLFVTGAIFAMRYFSSMASPDSALCTLMQPVSTFEKWLLGALITLVVYPLFYTLLFNVMTVPISWLGALIQSTDMGRGPTLSMDEITWQSLVYIPFYPYRDSSSSTVYEQIPLWSIYYGVCSYALTTSIIFKRLPMIKSIALSFGVFIFILLFFVVFGSSGTKVIFDYWWGDNESIFGILPTLVNTLCWLIAPTLMLIASFFALKERDLA